MDKMRSEQFWGTCRFVSNCKIINDLKKSSGADARAGTNSCSSYGYGAISLGWTLMAEGSISKRRSQSLGTLRPSIFAGENFQRCAAASVRSAKYGLGPGESNDASVTLPDSFT
jgi:hypothetical protein